MKLFQFKYWEPYYGIIILILGAICYIPFLGSVHLFDWDEINFAESSREMLVTGDYFRVMIEYQPFWEKPPFFFWLQALSMKTFGVNEFAARLPNAIMGIFTLLTLYYTGKRIKNGLFGFIWAFIYLISFLPFFYFKSGIIDPVFNYFIFTTLLFLIRAYQSSKPSHALLFALAAGLLNGMAVLTKGPVGLLLILLTYFFAWSLSKFKRILSFKQILLFFLGAIITSSFWYLPELLNNGPSFFKEFILYQVELFTKPVAGHKQPFFYHFLVVLIGCFPLSIFAIPGFIKRNSAEGLDVYRRWTIILVAVVMILFTIVQTKIVHYSSMAYLPLSFLAAGYIYHSIQYAKSISKWVMIMLAALGSVFSVIMIFIPYFFIHKSQFMQYVKDPFAKAAIEQNIHWTGTEYLFGGLFLLGLIVLIIYLVRKKTLQGIIIYGFFTMIVLTCYLQQVIPKIEKHSQGRIIEFYQSIQGEEVYVVPVGFKTYAHLFYFQHPNYPNQPHGIERRDWLTKGIIDKPVYIVVKNTEKYVKELPDVSFVKQVGGYMIYRRERNDGL